LAEPKETSVESKPSCRKTTESECAAAYPCRVGSNQHDQGLWHIAISSNGWSDKQNRSARGASKRQAPHVPPAEGKSFAPSRERKKSQPELSPLPNDSGKGIFSIL
jgi:hypothetical protein